MCGGGEGGGDQDRPVLTGDSNTLSVPSDTERQLLGEGCEVFLKKVLQVDTHSKKGEPTEPKTLVCRHFIIALRLDKHTQLGRYTGILVG